MAAAVGFAPLLIGAVGSHAPAGDYADSKLRTQAITAIVLFLGSAAAILALTMSPN
jgi:hypothetical protein